MIHNGTRALRYLLFISCLLFSMTAMNPVAYAQFSSQMSGDWNNAGTWGQISNVPGPTDVVTINAGDIVTVNVLSTGSNQCKNLTMGSGNGTATLTFAAGASLEVSEFVTFGGSGSAQQGVISLASGASLKVAQLIAGNVDGATWIPGESTVELTGTGDITLPSEVFSSYHDLIINKTSGTLSLAGDISVSGDWTANSQFDPSTFTVTFNGAGNQAICGTAVTTFQNLVNNSSGTLTLNQDVSLTGSWTNNSAIASGTRTVTFTGASAQILGGSAPSPFYHLTIDKTGSALWLNNDISVAGNWTNNWAVNAGLSTVTFNGAGNQTIGGSAVNTFASVTVNKGSGTLDLAGNSATVAGTLTLTSGKLSLGNYDLTVGSLHPVLGGSAASYIKTDGTGSLKRTVGAKSVSYPVVFPVGTSSGYNPATISATTGSDVFSVSVKETLDHPLLNNAYVNRQWSIVEQVPGGNVATITLQWNTADEPLSGFNRTGLYIFHYVSSNWSGTSAAYSDLGGGVYKATAIGFTSFSPFAIGNIGATPVELTSFTARYFSPEVRLDWSTATELNNYGFEIERSGNGVDWENIGFVQGAGNSFSQKNYTYTDDLTSNEKRSGSMAYRLKQIDRDGTTEYSKVVYVRLGAISRSIALYPAYPNPFNPSTTLSFSLPEASQLSVTVYNIFGQKVAMLLDGALTDAGFHTLDFNGNTLPSGSYLVRFETPGATLQQQIILSK